MDQFFKDFLKFMSSQICILFFFLPFHQFAKNTHLFRMENTKKKSYGICDAAEKLLNGNIHSCTNERMAHKKITLDLFYYNFVP